MFRRTNDGAPDADGDAGVFGGLFFVGDFEVEPDFAHVRKVVFFDEVLSADVGDAEGLVIHEDSKASFAAEVEHQELLEALRIGKGEVLVQAGKRDCRSMYLSVAGYRGEREWKLFEVRGAREEFLFWNREARGLAARSFQPS